MPTQTKEISICALFSSQLMEIAKMIKAFGAPIDPADAKTIGDYLKQNYGE